MFVSLQNIKDHVILQLLKGVCFHLWLFILMYGAPLVLCLCLVIVGLSLLLTVILMSLGFTCFAPKVRFFFAFEHFIRWYILSLRLKLKSFGVIMVLSTLTGNLEHILRLNAKNVIFLRLLVPLCSRCGFLNHYGVMFSLLRISLTACLLVYSSFCTPLPSFLTYLYPLIPFLLKCLVVLVLFTFLILLEANWTPRLFDVSSLVTSPPKKATNAMILTLAKLMFPWMSPFVSLSHSSGTNLFKGRFLQRKRMFFRIHYFLLFVVWRRRRHIMKRI